jgi:triacylglycerol lipase
VVEAPRNPIVLAHGLLGFNELRLGGKHLPSIQYWRGITKAMQTHGIEIITTSVPASGSIEERAAKLGHDIKGKAAGKKVNVIAYVLERI